MTHPYPHDAAEIRVLKLSGYQQFPLEYTMEKTLIITYNVSSSALLMKMALKRIGEVEGLEKPWL